MTTVPECQECRAAPFAVEGHVPRRFVQVREAFTGQVARHQVSGCLELRILVFILLLAVFRGASLASEPGLAAATNTFPAVSAVLSGRTFKNEFERDVFFLRAIHDHYRSYWPDLLEANISVEDYVLSPAKLLRFVDEVGKAMRDQNDPVACTNLALITGNATFYANTNAYHPEILWAAAEALIDIGPYRRKALASAFTQDHYRCDPVSLEQLAQVIGKERQEDEVLVGALAATAFEFSTTNGGSYPRCTP